MKFDSDIRFDRSIESEFMLRECSARMLAVLFAPERYKQIRGSVQHKVRLGKAGRTGNVADHLHDAFDPVKVGLAQPVLEGPQPLYKDGYFILDTALDGNRNTGHSFEGRAGNYGNGVAGRALSDQERAALIEYLKTL